VRLLIDANLSPRVAAGLRSEGHETVHVADIGMLGASDEAILAHAAASGMVIVSADTDFGELLAVSGQRGRRFVLLRSADHLSPDQQAPCWRPTRRWWPASLNPERPCRSRAAVSASARCPAITADSPSHSGPCRNSTTVRPGEPGQNGGLGG
jgi:predicted nuclease of predicted toxin-antitoxin system